jgi:epoxyqueuosine reductase
MTSTSPTLTLDQIAVAARAVHLTINGAFHGQPGDGTPENTGTLVMLGPDEPTFWAAFKLSGEYLDGLPDPMNRWSTSVITAMADRLDAQAVFPFGGPPYAPFISWATLSGHCWSSPVELLVHDAAGMFVSYRGAIAFSQKLDLPPVRQRPCDGCTQQPCLTSCPVGALGDDGYDVATCHAYLDTKPGRDCMTNGCLVRRSCPVSQTFPRDPAQSEFHMKAFHK